jgi:phospholipase/carboxylesterase
MTARFRFEETTRSPSADTTWRLDEGCLSEADVLRLLVPEADSSAAPAAPERPLDPDVYVPEGYEPNYAYPLVVWLTPAPLSGVEFHQFMSQISDRNYLGIQLRIDGEAADAAVGETGLADALPLVATIDDEFAQAAQPAASIPESLEAQLNAAVARMRRQYHVHTERVFLAGVGSAGTLALQLGLKRPEWFGGIFAFAAEFPKVERPLSHFRHLRQKRIFLGAGMHDEHTPAREVVRSSLLLQSAGLRVCTRVYDSGHELTASTFRDMNRWLMHGVCEPV